MAYGTANRMVPKAEILTFAIEMMTRLFAVFAFLLMLTSVQQLEAQIPGITISGTLLDSTNAKPLEYGTITIKHPGDSTIITGVLSDEAGKFKIQVATPGKYELQLYYVGYKRKILPLDITPGNPFTDLGKITLAADGGLLDVVEVTAERGYFQGSIDKKVYNIEKDIIASNGSASDALQTIPSVVIDIDGNISLRGSEGVRIFIDGKPSGIAGSNMNAILEQIPANTIESIEVVTNPSARYDAEGNSGIINIVLKKNKKIGLNGNITAGVSTSPRYEAGASLNYRNKKVNIYSNYSFTHDDRDGESYTYRKTFEEDTISYLLSNGSSNNISNMHMARAGIDYYLTDHTTLGVSGSWHDNAGSNTGLVDYSFLNIDSTLTSTSKRTTSGTNNGIGWNGGATIRHTFKDPKHVWSAEAYYANGSSDDSTYYAEDFYDATPAFWYSLVPQNISRPNENIDITAQSDYVRPFKNGNQFETGIKYTQEKKDNTFYSESFYSIGADPASWNADDSLNNQFIYNEDVIAGYLIWNGTFKKKFGYQIGLRAEQTYTLSQLITTDEDFTHDYFGLFPSAHVRYAVDETMEFSASYSRRIDRPNAWFLNPFRDYSDPYSFRQGNPFLDPEYENSYEIGFEKEFKKHSLTASLYYTKTLNEISPYITVTPEGVSYMTFQNYNDESKYGFELVTRDEFFKWWNMTGSFNFNQTLVNAENLEAGLTNNQFTYNIRLMHMFAVYKQTSLQLTMSYNTPWTFAQGESNAIYFMDAGVKSDFFQNKLSVNVNFSDIFNSRKWSGVSEGTNFYSEYSRKRQSQILSLKLTYKFGQQDNSRRRSNRGMDENYDGGVDMF